jgi:hypothetical protein
MFVCTECFGSKGLQQRLREIRPRLPNNKCDFHPKRKGIAIEEVAKIVDPVFRENYAGGIPDGVWDARGVDLSDVLYDLTEAGDDQVIRGLIQGLIDADTYWPPDGDEVFYSEEYSYVVHQPALGEHGRMWTKFRRSLLHYQRFFNKEARDLIVQIFEGIQYQRDASSQMPVYIIGPEDLQSTFLRARIANDPETRRKIEENLAENLGPPPERLRRAGRLNSSGTPAFYAAFDFETCVAELRPSVGSIVVAAEFRITEEICVLDTTRFDAKPKQTNPFAVGAIRRTAQWQFMQNFMGEIARPISPNDEHLEYIPTQAVAEYLTHHHRFVFRGAERTIDAIIYRSAQRPAGKNIAILGKAAVCGPTPEDRLAKKARQDADDKELFGWAFPDVAVEPVRIIPKSGSIRTEKVMGAEFRTQQFDDLDHEGIGSTF